MATIDEMLERRNARRLPPTVSVADIAARSPVTREIGRRFRGYFQLKQALHQDRPVDHGQIDRGLVELLTEQGVLVPALGSAAGYVVPRHWLQYFNGGWLEELACLAMMQIGVDELYPSQRIAWRLGARAGECEIDLIARRGEVLSFVSCKALRPWFKDDQRERLISFLAEADYWDHHFADGTGRVMLLVTTDLIDEINGHAERFPQLATRAEVFDVDVVSLDFFRWENLLERFRRHWD